MAQMNQEISGKIEGTSKLLKFLPQMQEEKAVSMAQSTEAAQEENRFNDMVTAKEKNEIQPKVQEHQRESANLGTRQQELTIVNQDISSKTDEISANNGTISGLDARMSANTAEIVRLRESAKTQPESALLEPTGNNGLSATKETEKQGTGKLPDDIQKRISDLEAENQKIAAEMKRLEEENKRLAGQIKTLEEKQKSLTEDISRIEGLLAQITSQLETLQQERDALAEKSEKASEQKSLADAEVQKLQKSIDAEQKEITSREEQVHRSQEIHERNMTYHQSEKLEANSFLDQTLDGGYGVFA